MHTTIEGGGNSGAVEVLATVTEHKEAVDFAGEEVSEALAGSGKGSRKNWGELPVESVAAFFEVKEKGSAKNKADLQAILLTQVSRHFFRWTKEIAYAEYYERALINAILGIQRGREPGVMIYMLPLGRGVFKAISYRGWETKFDSFWCRCGTGIELFSKLGDPIDFEEEGKVPGIYITQFI
ncbi:hypothetical protein RHSIM_Rhsim06G0098200 [Rhododendron simsii]|uniref:Non-reducing end beta-L-arabinofuranosidase-like GH127 catalytic domain-containing protein n=1 Tax=Rhododendron simsii TaxID=118357 RepID=A0A834GUC0_RHOSS|nr:hypothetical protein RHSIM_Rhsim06G0098200 [Rhododendron simsii]